MTKEHIGERHKINLFWFNQKDPSLNQQMQSPEGKTLKQPYFLGTPNFQGVKKSLKECSFIKKTLCYRYFLINFVKLLKTLNLQNT